jgi:AraC-like DNA-binding protein
MGQNISAQETDDHGVPEMLPTGSARSGVMMVRVDALRNFKPFAASLGADPDALLRRFQIEPSALDNYNSVIPYRVMVQLLECAASELKCPDFGMRLAAIQENTKVLGPLDFVMRNSATLGNAFRYCADHVQAYSLATQITLERARRSRRIFMRFEILLSRLPHQRQAVEHALALVQYAAEAISGGRVRGREVWFSHEPVASAATYRARFNASLRFEQSMNGIFFDEDDLELPVPHTDPQLYEMATSFVDQRFPCAAKTLTARVRTLIERLLIDGNCSYEQVAGGLNLHPRTLQRRLREEEESFEGIRDSVRRELALRYLRQPNVPLVQVAAVLGYSETSVLSRSCYRWFAASPRQLRHELNS